MGRKAAFIRKDACDEDGSKLLLEVAWEPAMGPDEELLPSLLPLLPCASLFAPCSLLEREMVTGESWAVPIERDEGDEWIGNLTCPPSGKKWSIMTGDDLPLELRA